jgi:hypothetical protein
MDDTQILQSISRLVDEEHQLRNQVQSGQLSSDEEHSRLRTVEEALDQAWDLLRRRRAARESGTSPEEAKPRPVGEVERYLQ